MLAQVFNRIVEERRRKIDNVLASKAEEYASDNDRLHNFKVAARIDEESPEKALWGMFKKHLVSVQDMVNASESKGKAHSPSLIDEKIGDSINYLILLEGIMRERFAAVTPEVAKAASKVRGVEMVGKASSPPAKPRKRASTRKKAAVTRKKATKKKKR